MAGTLNFDESAFKFDYLKIESNLKNMESDLINILQEFIQKMPEFQSIINGEAGRSNSTNTIDFWKSISGNDSGIPDIDDLIGYISDNYSEEFKEKAEELVGELGSVREACIKTCKESGEQLIKRQQEMIDQNRQIIEEEENKLHKLQNEVEKLESRKIDLEAEAARYNVGDPRKEKVESKILGCEQHITKKEDEISSLTTRTRVNKQT